MQIHRKTKCSLRFRAFNMVGPLSLKVVGGTPSSGFIKFEKIFVYFSFSPQMFCFSPSGCRGYRERISLGIDWMRMDTMKERGQSHRWLWRLSLADWEQPWMTDTGGWWEKPVRVQGFQTKQVLYTGQLHQGKKHRLITSAHPRPQLLSCKCDNFKLYGAWERGPCMTVNLAE